MNATTFDRYLEGASAVHRLDPRVKVLVALGFILGVALLPDAAWPAHDIVQKLERSLRTR